MSPNTLQLSLPMQRFIGRQVLPSSSKYPSCRRSIVSMRRRYNNRSIRPSSSSHTCPSIPLPSSLSSSSSLWSLKIMGNPSPYQYAIPTTSTNKVPAAQFLNVKRALSTLSTTDTNTNTNSNRRTTSRAPNNNNHTTINKPKPKRHHRQHQHNLRNSQRPIIRNQKQVERSSATGKVHSNANVNHGESSSSFTSSNATLDKCIKIMATLQQRHEAIVSSSSSSSSTSIGVQVPFTWITCNTLNQVQSVLSPQDWDQMQLRRTLYLDTVTLLKIVELSRSSNRIPNSFQNYRILKSILDQSLAICSNSPPSYWWKAKEEEEEEWNEYENDTRGSSSGGGGGGSGRTLFQTAQQIRRLLDSIHSDMEPQHYHSMIKSAVLERDYESAAQLFQTQIDVDVGGYVPMEGRLGWDTDLELGLWAVAKQAQLELEEDRQKEKEQDSTQEEGERMHDKLHVVQRVFDAVLNMCLMLPTDQERYVLAAGAVLGRSHQWKELMEFAKLNSEKSEGEISKLGQPLVAAAMYACVLNEKYEEALDLHNYVIKSPQLGASEWQWGGGYGGVHPLLRDLSLISMGFQSRELLSEYDDESPSHMSSAKGIDTLQQIVEEGGSISLDAFKGVLSMCEVEGNFENAIQILHMIMNYNQKSDWTIVKRSLENFLMENPEHVQHTETDLRSICLVDDDILAKVMNSCNTAGEFGLALLLCRLVSSVEEVDTDFSHSVPTIVKRLLLSQKLLSKSDELLTSTMLALCGVGCIREARALYSEVVGSGFSDNKSHWQSSTECFAYVMSLHNESNQSWRSAFKSIDRVLSAIESMNETDFVLGESEEQSFSQGVAQMMKSCATAQQGLVGLHLAKHGSVTVMKRQNSVSNVKKAIQSFFGLKSNDTFNFNDESNEATSFLSSSDAMLSGAMECYLNSRIPKEKEALALFFSKWEIDANLQEAVKNAPSGTSNWILSTNAVLELLIERDSFESAESFFQAIHPNNRVAETYLIMARGFIIEEKWEEISKLYVVAAKNGFLSEELGILAMEAIAKSKLDGKVRILRQVADDNASIMGMQQRDWIAENYWVLKRHVGFHYARLLMWWNNPKKTQEQELELAIKQFEKARGRRFQVDEDILKCIVKLAQNERYMKRINQNNDDDKSEYVDILLEATLEARRHTLGADPSFIYDAVSALTTLNASEECINLIRISVAEGIQVDMDTLTHGVEAASATQDEGALEEFQTLLSYHK